MKNPVDRFLPLDAARHTADAYGNHAIDEFLAGRITRRELLRHASVIGLALAGGGVLLFVALSLQGLAMGTENTHEQVYWQTLTPDELLGRTNATRRSVNRTMAAAGALAAGLFLGLVGERLVLDGVILVFAAAALTAALSPLREAPERR